MITDAVLLRKTFKRTGADIIKIKETTTKGE